MKPVGDIATALQSGSRPLIAAQFTVRSDINMEPLLDALRSNTQTEIRAEYVDNKFQSITITNAVTKQELQATLAALPFDYTDFDIKTATLLPNVSGLMQLFVFYCFSQRVGGKHGRT